MCNELEQKRVVNSTIKSVANSFLVLASLPGVRSVMLTQFWLSCLYGVILKLLEKCNAHTILVLKGFWSREPSVLTKIKAANVSKKRKIENYKLSLELNRVTKCQIPTLIFCGHTNNVMVPLISS